MLQSGISMNSDLQIVQSSISSRAVLLLSRLNQDAGRPSTSFDRRKIRHALHSPAARRRHREPAKYQRLFHIFLVRQLTPS